LVDHPLELVLGMCERLLVGTASVFGSESDFPSSVFGRTAQRQHFWWQASELSAPA